MITKNRIKVTKNRIKDILEVVITVGSLAAILEIGPIVLDYLKPKDYLGEKRNGMSVMSYTLLENKNIRVAEYNLARQGFWAPKIYEISLNQSKYDSLLTNIRRGN